MNGHRPEPALLEPARSLAHKRPFVVAMLLSCLQYLAMLAAATLAFILFQSRSGSVLYGFIAAVLTVMLSWLFAFLQRRGARCPLCKGTPLLDTAASKHRDARRIKPLNYGTSALVGMITSHRFRCMYCGTLFDLLKKRSN